MRCANPECGKIAEHLFDGTLRLIELDLPPGRRTTGEESGFPVCIVPTRYFWLCPECSNLLEIHRWTPKGIIVKPIAQSATLANAQTFSTSNPIRSRTQRGAQIACPAKLAS